MTPGATRAQGSYWSELSGIYRIITTINAVTTYYQQPQGTVLIVCDGEATLTKSMNQWTSNPLDKQFDIIHAIKAGIRQTKITWKSKHIKGHQEQVALLLCDKARWNDEMDKVAKKHWEHIQTNPDPPINSLLGKPWELWLDDKKVSTTVKSQLLEHTCGQAAQNYWSNKTRFNGMDTKSIDWTAIHKVVTGMTIKQRWWTTKFVTRFCMTGQRMHQWGKRETATCPHCKHETETMVHILQCLHPGVQTISDSCIKDL